MVDQYYKTVRSPWAVKGGADEKAHKQIEQTLGQKRNVICLVK